ncbi:phosphatase PAP2 family protein [Streptomyces sp. A7024]|uniref:Phosphatase PAP2 family protein n=1 Tax=Streptomyces coryli TaxID=1128680 RepID=A0A6G4TY58_9ACTN|nr:phosphatase PAP2 family protein [Streptomyces coryli]NGN64702.1 phosphatase PAP2 family protein [Streptomyces coryli]
MGRRTPAEQRTNTASAAAPATAAAAARALALAAGLLAAAVAALVWLAPGGVGTPDPVEIRDGASADAYRTLSDAAADTPGWAHTLLEAATEGTLLALAALLGWLAWTALRRRDASALAGVGLTGAATVAAYGISEALKLAVDEARPCRTVPGVDALATCPPPGDWSFPSNHATIAAALAIGVTLLRPRWAALALPLGAAAALLRVLVGAHYPHDVAAGAILGAALAGALLLAGRGPATGVTEWLVRKAPPAAGRVQPTPAPTPRPSSSPSSSPSRPR